MNPPPARKKCSFRTCHIMIPVTDEVCEHCIFLLHLEIRKQQGIDREIATVEYQREQGPSLN